jgi:hypothetical protein
MREVIFGLSGIALTQAEKNLIEDKKPHGIILFTRNCKNAQQIIDLNRSVKDISPETKIFIDQEGGRVRRIKPPISGLDLPSMEVFGKDYDLNKFLPLHERAVVSMRSWLNSLSKFTKISNSISKKASILRDIIFKSEFQPLIAIDELSQLGELEDIKIELDKFDSKMLKEMGNYILSLFKLNGLEELKASLSNFSKPMVKNNKLLNSIRQGESLDEVSSILINKITELNIKDLSDTLFEMLQGQIDKHYKNAVSGDYDSDSINRITLNGEEFVVNKVDKTTTGINLKERLNGLIQAKNLRVSK